MAHATLGEFGELVGVIDERDQATSWTCILHALVVGALILVLLHILQMVSHVRKLWDVHSVFQSANLLHDINSLGSYCEDRILIHILLCDENIVDQWYHSTKSLLAGKLASSPKDGTQSCAFGQSRNRCTRLSLLKVICAENLVKHTMLNIPIGNKLGGEIRYY